MICNDEDFVTIQVYNPNPVTASNESTGADKLVKVSPFS